MYEMRCEDLRIKLREVPAIRCTEKMGFWIFNKKLKVKKYNVK